jgi:hypothetical protein
MYARQALLKDEQLAGRNLGISVRQGIATVWGPVPSEAVARRAVERLREVKGLLDVRSQLYVAAAAEPPPKSSGRPALLPLEPLMPNDLDNPAGTLKYPRTAAGGPRPPPVSGDRPARPLSEAVALLAPVPPGGWNATPTSSSNLASSVEELWRSDLRYRIIRPQIQGSVVYLHGMASRREDMLDLAERLSRLPGVERVILKEGTAGFAGR